MNIIDILRLSPVVPVLTVTKVEHAAPLAQALTRGGLRVLEITLRTEAAFEIVGEMRRAVPDAVIGVGTLTREEEFARAVKAGAQFGVSPGITETVTRGARDSGLPLLPGIMTPSELMQARTAGFTALKLFPAEVAGGVQMLKALAAPFADVVFCPTGGITRTTAPEYLALGNVACVGGSWLAPPDLLAAGDWSAIENLARDAANLPRKFRG